jgi:hypothetical protein
MRMVISLVAAVGLIAGPTAGLAAPSAAAAPLTTPTWWRVDSHEHSSFSGDARADLGVDAERAKSSGYNAVFVTDHDRMASFQVGGANGNYLDFRDTIAGGKWLAKNIGTFSSVTNATSATQIKSGSASLHVAASSTSAGRAMDYAKRGPSLHAGDVSLDFWVYPQQIIGAAGVDVSVSVGGDPRPGTASFGYTNATGTTMLKQSSTLVWQLGAARKAAATGTAHVYTNQLNYTPLKWNHYTINVRTGAVSWTVDAATASSTGIGLNGMVATDQPADWTTLTNPIMEASADNGTADAYFDDLTLKDLSPVCPAADFVYRNSLIDSGRFNGTNVTGEPFVMYPAREMGQNNHANQFNFDLTNPADFNDTFVESAGSPIPAPYNSDAALCAATNTATARWQFKKLGTDNIGGATGVQASGYPAQDNHPGVTDTTANVTATLAHGADAVEVRGAADYSATWDTILQQNHIVIGTYGSDAHEGPSATTPADYIDAPSLGLDNLMRSYYEGRMYLANANFTGRIVFNTDGSARPYPARYPVYVSPSTLSVTPHLAISGGLVSGQTVSWISYSSGAGTTRVTDIVSGTTYNASKVIALSGAFSYVRAELRDAAGNLLANTEPIFYRPVASLTADKSIRVDAVTPPSGCACSAAVNKGITSTTYNSNALVVNMSNPAGSVVALSATSADAPVVLTIDGASVAPSATAADFTASTGDAWFYSAASQTLQVQDAQGGADSTVTVGFSDSPVDAPPTVPDGLSAAAVTATRVDLNWTSSTDTDATPVAGYHVFRDGSLVATVTAGTSASDTTVPGAGTYRYTVSAYDSATPALESGKSTAVSVTTTNGQTAGTFPAVADAYVDEGGTVNHGTATTLRVDTTAPLVNSYLRFTLTGLAPTRVSATLRIFSNSSLTAGVSVRSVSDDTWGERTILFSNAPPVGAAGVGSGALTAASWTDINVTSLVSSTAGNVDLALVGLSSTAVSLASRESANPPQLLVTAR